MSKGLLVEKKKTLKTSVLKRTLTQDELITLQFRYIKELSQLKYEAEEKREQNLIQQSSQMQTVFSFMTAAIFMAVPICVEFRGILSLEFFLISISITVMFLIASLVLASIAQWRWKTKTIPDVTKIKEEIINIPEWKKFTVEYSQINHLIETTSRKSKT